MKMKTLKIALATAAVGVASNSAMAIGYDAANEVINGIAFSELHAWQARSDFDEGECTTAVCQGLNGGQTEIVGVIQMLNESTCVLRTVDESPLELTGSCAGPSPNLDNYCGQTGANPLPPSGCPSGVDAAAPTHPLLNVTSGNDVPPSFAPVGPITVFASWDVDTAVNGKITGGYYLADTTFMGTTVIGLVDFDKRVLVNASGTIANVPVSCWTDPATVTEADYVACGGTGVTVSNVTGVDYITVDDTQLGGKAVPVPAFAAAALGLGLVGVTVLTGRRRQVK